MVSCSSRARPALAETTRGKAGPARDAGFCAPRSQNFGRNRDGDRVSTPSRKCVNRIAELNAVGQQHCDQGKCFNSATNLSSLHLQNNSVPPFCWSSDDQALARWLVQRDGPCGLNEMDSRRETRKNTSNRTHIVCARVSVDQSSTKRPTTLHDDGVAHAQGTKPGRRTSSQKSSRSVATRLDPNQVRTGDESYDGP